MSFARSLRPWVLVSAFGCGAAVPAPKARPSQPAVAFAVAPPTWATEPEATRVNGAALIAGSQELGGVRAMAIDEGPECAAEPPCLRRLDSQALDKLVTVRLAALGETVLVRGTLVDIRSGTQDESRQVVVNSASGPRIDAAMRELGRAFAKPYAPPPVVPKKQTPAYETWWFWTTLGASLAVTGAVVTGVVVATQPQPDVVINPP